MKYKSYQKLMKKRTNLKIVENEEKKSPKIKKENKKQY